MVLGSSSHFRRAPAQEAAPDTRVSHPILRVWMVAVPTDPALAVFSAGGAKIQGVPAAQDGPQGVIFTGAHIGTWEPADERRIHFTGVQLLTDAAGTFVGSVTIDGHPRVTDDGQTFVDDAPEKTITIRDAADAVRGVIKPFPAAPPATAVRMGVGAPGFSERSLEAGTPVP